MTEDHSKPSRGRPKTIDAAQVLDVVVDAYWRDDPADVSINAVCKMAGVSKPSLYREFRNEDGLTRAVLDLYAERVLSDVFAILNSGAGLRATLDALVDFATADPRMETGCLYYKMRVGKHRLGTETRLRLDEIEAAAQAGYLAFLDPWRETAAWPDGLSVEAAAKYLGEQLGLAFALRAANEDPADVRAMLELALSVFPRDIDRGPG
jgi:AcrR family transcriptional regulator